LNAGVNHKLSHKPYLLKIQGCSNCAGSQAPQANDVSIGPSQDRSSSTGAVGEDQAGEENCLKKLQVGKSIPRPAGTDARSFFRITEGCSE
jgi:hypothetical protein